MYYKIKQVNCGRKEPATSEKETVKPEETTEEVKENGNTK